MPARVLGASPHQEGTGSAGNVVHAAGTPRRATPSGIALNSFRSQEAVVRGAQECHAVSLRDR
ncbi:predicted protein [Streptomyces viridosporus ATCC 14672]|uniref:Predicted protein n=1 Tax=Streptomyces viridosporus (strain ATCC 14672 / DSM 40746 / JCM 4963 / KCTC 9882 / NRRL B-12104 / FH 1290) TaxID=566461 RepID=D5ZVP6_STRV1|nr:predicted protein [Streptomyces viridosporus ATCC 14672]